MPEERDKTRAAQAVRAELAHRKENPSWLAREAAVDPGTIGDFLAASRWPKLGTQGKIEHALGWPAGTISAIADGAEPPARDALAAVWEPPQEVHLLTPRQQSAVTEIIRAIAHPDGGGEAAPGQSPRRGPITGRGE